MAKTKNRIAARDTGFPDSARLVIWGNSNRLRARTLRAANFEFRQTPYEIKRDDAMELKSCQARALETLREFLLSASTDAGCATARERCRG